MDLVEVHRLEERAGVLTRRITLEARAEEEADELRFGYESDREPEAAVEETGSADSPKPRSAGLGGPAPAGTLGN